MVFTLAGQTAIEYTTDQLDFLVETIAEDFVDKTIRTEADLRQYCIALSEASGEFLANNNFLKYFKNPAELGAFTYQKSNDTLRLAAYHALFVFFTKHIPTLSAEAIADWQEMSAVRNRLTALRAEQLSLEDNDTANNNAQTRRAAQIRAAEAAYNSPENVTARHQTQAAQPLFTFIANIQSDGLENWINDAYKTIIRKNSTEKKRVLERHFRVMRKYQVLHTIATSPSDEIYAALKPYESKLPKEILTANTNQVLYGFHIRRAEELQWELLENDLKIEFLQMPKLKRNTFTLGPFLKVQHKKSLAALLEDLRSNPKEHQTITDEHLIGYIKMYPLSILTSAFFKNENLRKQLQFVAEHTNPEKHKMLVALQKRANKKTGIFIGWFAKPPVDLSIKEIRGWVLQHQYTTPVSGSDLFYDYIKQSIYIKSYRRAFLVNIAQFSTEEFLKMQEKEWRLLEKFAPPHHLLLEKTMPSGLTASVRAFLEAIQQEYHSPALTTFIKRLSQLKLIEKFGFYVNFSHMQTLFFSDYIPVHKDVRSDLCFLQWKKDFSSEKLLDLKIALSKLPFTMQAFYTKNKQRIKQQAYTDLLWFFENKTEDFLLLAKTHRMIIESYGKNTSSKSLKNLVLSVYEKTKNQNFDHEDLTNIFAKNLAIAALHHIEPAELLLIIHIFGIENIIDCVQKSTHIINYCANNFDVLTSSKALWVTALYQRLLGLDNNTCIGGFNQNQTDRLFLHINRNTTSYFNLLVQISEEKDAFFEAKKIINYFSVAHRKTYTLKTYYAFALLGKKLGMTHTVQSGQIIPTLGIFSPEKTLHILNAVESLISNPDSENTAENPYSFIIKHASQNSMILNAALELHLATQQPISMIFERLEKLNIDTSKYISFLCLNNQTNPLLFLEENIHRNTFKFVLEAQKDNAFAGFFFRRFKLSNFSEIEIDFLCTLSTKSGIVLREFIHKKFRQDKDESLMFLKSFIQKPKSFQDNFCKSISCSDVAIHRAFEHGLRIAGLDSLMGNNEPNNYLLLGSLSAPATERFYTWLQYKANTRAQIELFSQIVDFFNDLNPESKSIFVEKLEKTSAFICEETGELQFSTFIQTLGFAASKKWGLPNTNTTHSGAENNYTDVPKNRLS